MGKTWGIVSFFLFIIGLILAVIGGLFLPGNAWALLILAVIGLIIGLIHLKDKENNTLLLATIALLAMTAAFAPITFFDIGKMVGSMLLYFAAMMAPVALIASIKALLHLGLTENTDQTI